MSLFSVGDEAREKQIANTGKRHGMSEETSGKRKDNREKGKKSRILISGRDIAKQDRFLCPPLILAFVSYLSTIPQNTKTGYKSHNTRKQRGKTTKAVALWWRPHYFKKGREGGVSWIYDHEIIGKIK